MIKIHDNFYMTAEDGIQFIYNDNLLYIEDDEEDKIILNEKEIEDLLWFIKNIIKRGEKG